MFNRKNISKTIALCLGVLIMSFLIGYLVFAWTEPTIAPPGGNVYGPINVGPVTQDKTGWFTFEGGGTRNSTFLATITGNVGIGTTSPDPAYKLHVNATTVGGGLKVETNYSAPANYGITGVASGGTTVNRGGNFAAGGGTESYGVIAGVSDASSNNYGVYGSASGDTGIKYALYGSASGVGTNWGLYVVSGNSFLSGNVGIGTTSPGTNKLEVVGGPIKATGGLIIETRTSDPLTPVEGQIWLRTDL